jgi:hypothetical protein
VSVITALLDTGMVVGKDFELETSVDEVDDDDRDGGGDDDDDDILFCHSQKSNDTKKTIKQLFSPTQYQ